MKNVLITGVSKGIGRAIAEKFLNEGYAVYGTFFRDKDKAEELISKYGSDRVCLYGPYDFTKEEEIIHFIDKVKDRKIDSLICSAGIFSEIDDFNEFNLDEFKKTMNCNFYAPLILSIGLRDCLNHSGSIVIMSSNDAYSGAYSSISYTVSKSAVISLMKCLSVNYGARNVRVNAVAPGAIDTDMNTPEQMNIAPYFSPTSRVGKPEDVANVVFFLTSDESCFINGETITIDGGYSNVSILLKSEADPLLSQTLQKICKKARVKKV